MYVVTHIHVAKIYHLLLSAKVVVELAKFDDIKAAVMLHPSFVTVDDIRGTTSSLSLFNDCDTMLFLVGIFLEL
jgi:hypothetical protein